MVTNASKPGTVSEKTTLAPGNEAVIEAPKPKRGGRRKKAAAEQSA